MIFIVLLSEEKWVGSTENVLKIIDKSIIRNLKDNEKTTPIFQSKLWNRIPPSKFAQYCISKVILV